MLDANGHEVERREVLTLVSKTGIDGSGSHRIRHQMADNSKSLEENPHLDPNIYKNYLLTCFTPLTHSYKKVGKPDTVIWNNNNPNSISYTRPISLIRTIESREVIESEFSGLFSKLMNTKTQVNILSLIITL